MGVHFPDVRNVIHWGLPDSIIQYWQQLGQAGHDGQPSFSYLYAHSRSIQHRSDCIIDLYHVCHKYRVQRLRRYVLSDKKVFPIEEELFCFLFHNCQ